jgi:hypothetical protein
MEAHSPKRDHGPPSRSGAPYVLKSWEARVAALFPQPGGFFCA